MAKQPVVEPTPSPPPEPAPGPSPMDPWDPNTDPLLRLRAGKKMGGGYIDADEPTPGWQEPAIRDDELNFLYLRKPQHIPESLNPVSVADFLEMNRRYAKREEMREAAIQKRYYSQDEAAENIISESLPKNEIHRIFVAGNIIAGNRIGGTLQTMSGDIGAGADWHRVGRLFQRGIAKRAEDPDNVLAAYIHTHAPPAVANVEEALLFGKAAIPYFAAATFHDVYHDAKARGISNERALWHGLEHAAYEGAIAFAMGKITGLHGLEGMNAGAQKALADTTAKAAWAFAKEFGAELIEEYITETLQNMANLRLADAANDWDDVTWAENARDVLFATAITMGGSKAFTTMVNESMRRLQEGQEALTDAEITRIVDQAFPDPKKRRFARVLAGIAFESFQQQYGQPTEVEPGQEAEAAAQEAEQADLKARIQEKVNEGNPMEVAREEAALELQQEQEARTQAEEEQDAQEDVEEAAGVPVQQEGEPAVGEAEAEAGPGDTEGSRPGPRQRQAETPEERRERQAAEARRQLLRGDAKPVSAAPNIVSQRSLEGPNALPDTVDILEGVYEGDRGALEEAAAEMALEAHRQAVLVPLPDATGSIETSLALAEEMAAVGSAAQIVKGLTRRKDGTLQGEKGTDIDPEVDVVYVSPLWAGGNDVEAANAALGLEGRLVTFADDTGAPPVEREPGEEIMVVAAREEVPPLRPPVKGLRRPTARAATETVAERPAAPDVSPEAMEGLDIVGVEDVTVDIEPEEAAEAPQAAPEAAPAPTEAEVRAPKQRRQDAPKRRRIPERDYGTDVLNEIEDAGRIRSRPKRYEGGEYDDKPLLRGVYTGLMSAREGLMPDKMAAALQERGIGDGTANTMWRLVREAMDSRKAEREEIAAREEMEREQEAALRAQADVDEDALQAYERETTGLPAVEVVDRATTAFDEVPFDMAQPGATPNTTAILIKLLERHVGRYGDIYTRPDGSVVVRSKRGDYVRFVPRPTPAEFRGRPLAEQPGGAFRGLFYSANGEVTAEVDVYPAQLVGTYGHEMVHVFRAMGLITDAEVAAIAKESIRQKWHQQVAPTYERAYAKVEEGRRREMIQEELVADVIERISDGRIIERSGSFFAVDRETNKETPLALKPTFWERVKGWIDDMMAVLGVKGARRRRADRQTTRERREAMRQAADIAAGRPFTREGAPTQPIRPGEELESKRRREALGEPVAAQFAMARRDPNDGETYNDPEESEDRREEGPAPIWYNKTLRLVNSRKMPQKGTGDQMLAFLRANGISERELYWTGLDLIAGDETVTADQVRRVADLDAEGSTRLVEVDRRRRGPDPTPRDISKAMGPLWDTVLESWGREEIEGVTVYPLTLNQTVADAVGTMDGVVNSLNQEGFNVIWTFRHYDGEQTQVVIENADPGALWEFPDYRIPGGQDYRELTISAENPRLIPDPYTRGHWSADNVLVHARFDSRQDADGSPILFVQELQSDWHQAAQRKGYQDRGLVKHYGEIRGLVQGERMDVATRTAAMNDYLTQLTTEGQLPSYKLGTYNDRGWPTVEIDEGKFFTLEQVAEDGVQRWAMRHPNGALLRFDPAFDREGAERQVVMHALSNREVARNLAVGRMEKMPELRGEPEAPFKKSWPELGVRRLLREAVDADATWLAWDNGPDIADVVGLTEGVNEQRQKKRQGVLNFYGKRLPRTAQKVLNSLGVKEKVQTIRMARPVSPEELTGAEHDAIMADAANVVNLRPTPTGYVGEIAVDGVWQQQTEPMTSAEAQVWMHDQRAQVFQGILATKPLTQEYQAIRITPAIRKAVMDGQPLQWSLPPTRTWSHNAAVTQDKTIEAALEKLTTQPRMGSPALALANPWSNENLRELSADPEAAERIAQALIAAPVEESVWSRMWANIKEFWQDSRRTYKFLDEKTYSELIDVLKTLDNEISAAPIWAARQILAWQDGMTEEEKTDFTLALALPDVIRELEPDPDGEPGLYDDNPGGIPFYGRGEEETRSVAEIRAVIEKDLQAVMERAKRPVQRALERREDFHQQLTAELVEAGLLQRDVLKDNRYWHRMVLKYLNEKTISSGMGRSGIRQKKVPAQFQRIGGGDFSLNYLMSELEYIASMNVQLSKGHALARINELHGIQGKLKDQANELNDFNVLEIEAARIMAENPGMDPVAAREQAAEWNMEFRQRIAMNGSWLVQRLAKGEIRGTPFPAMEEEAAEAWQQYQEDLDNWRDMTDSDPKARPQFRFNHDDWFPFLSYLASGQHGKIMVAHQVRAEDGSRTTEYSEDDPTLNALSIFKATAEQKVRMKEMLGRKYLTWKNLADQVEGYKRWQPKPGLLVVPGFSVSDHMVNEVLAQAGVTCDEDVLAQMPDMVQIQTGKIKRAQMVIGLRPEWCLPAEVADQLDRMETTFADEQAKTMLTRGLQYLTRTWKPIILFGPYRWLKYEFNNMSGDLDAALSHPGILKQVPGAAKDLWKWLHRTPGEAAKSSGLFGSLAGTAIGVVMTGGLGGAALGLVAGGGFGYALGGLGRTLMGPGDEMDHRQMMAEKYGVIDSGQLMNEVEQNGWNRAEKLVGKKDTGFTLNPFKIVKGAISGYYGAVRNFNAWREGVLRLAAARYFYRKLGGAHGRRKGRRYYGASRKDAMDVLYNRLEEYEREGDIEEAIEMRERISARLARELLGDYGSISETGRALRRGLAPFWAWQEVNFPRYVRLIKNARYEGGNGTSRGIALGAGLTIKTAMAVGALSVMVAAWNAAAKALWDIPDEEDPNAQGGRHMFIILGRYDDGSVKAIKFAGALMDALGWLGADDISRNATNYRRADNRGEAAEGIKQIAADVGKAPIQRLADVTTPLIKTPVELVSGQRYYPDLFRPRKIKDRTDVALGVVGLQQPYRVFTGKAGVEMLANGLVYEFTPGAQSYWRARGLVYDFNEGKQDDSRERTFAMSQAKSAWSRDDKERARYWINRYFSIPGSSWKGYRTSIRTGHPLYWVGKKRRQEFLDSLDEEDRRMVELGVKWWEETGAGTEEFNAMAMEEAKAAGAYEK